MRQFGDKRARKRLTKVKPPGEPTFTAYNARYLNYCRAQGNAPDIQAELDLLKYPGARMLAYVEWNRARLLEASRAIPDAFFMGHLSDHDAYDRWLTEYVDALLERKDPHVPLHDPAPAPGPAPHD